MSSFYIGDRKIIRDHYSLWTSNLPKIKPFYALKCNPQPEVIRVLDQLGSSFDCASLNEMKLVREMGIMPERIIFSHPIKSEESIIYAREEGIKILVFDNKEEFFKIHRLYPQAQLLLRLLVNDEQAVCRLSNKFGASLEESQEILKIKEVQSSLVGLSFHVGSGCQKPEPYLSALDQCRRFLDAGLHINLIDIGGGFTSSSFLSVAQALRQYQEEHLPHMELIAEPGRFFVADAFQLTTTIIGKKKRKNSFHYYLNDGIYQSFNCIFFDHQNPRPLSPTSSSELYDSVLFGATCDGLDCLISQVKLPELNIGDPLIFPQMGAYTLSAVTYFNGFPPPEVQYIN